jgi:hypothetical protein
MAEPISNDELDDLIWKSLRDDDRHPPHNAELVRLTWSTDRICSRLQAMRKAGRIRFWRHPPASPNIRAHGWEVLGCPGAGISENGQFDWAYGCADCLRRVRPEPADGVIEPPPIVAFECELRIEPST